ncbi:MAG: hypothetical protein R3B07_02070 [Polyangiaceae bacterium]
MRLHKPSLPYQLRITAGILTLLALVFFTNASRADLALDDRRRVERRVVIANLADFAGWKIVAYPYNFSGGVPQIGLATFDVIGLTPPPFMDARVYAIPPGNNVDIPKDLETEEGIKRLKAAHALDSGLMLGGGSTVANESQIRSVREVLRIKELTPESFQLERMALEYGLEGEVEERVDCPPRGACRGPAREPAVRLELTHHVSNDKNPATPAPSDTPNIEPPVPSALANAAPLKNAKPPDPPMSPLIWVAIAGLILGVGLFVLRPKKSDSDSASP